jgi:hypothetical protein
MIKLIFSISILATLSCCSNKRKAATAMASTPAEAATTSTINKEIATEEEGIVTTIKVIRTSCASMVAIITDDTKLDKGEEWVPYNVRMSKPYRGAFSFLNLEDFSKVKENYVFKAKLIAADKAPKSTVQRCAMADYPPATEYYVKALTTPKEEQ